MRRRKPSVKNLSHAYLTDADDSMSYLDVTSEIEIYSQNLSSKPLM